jgi:hypothetical protein
MKAFWKYTVARLGLFAVVFLGIWAVTNAVRPVPVPFTLIAAFIVSGVISIFALRGMREEVASKFAKDSPDRLREDDDLD